MRAAKPSTSTLVRQQRPAARDGKDKPGKNKQSQDKQGKDKQGADTLAKSSRSAKPPAKPAPAPARRSLPIVANAPKQVGCLSCGLCCSYVAVDCEDPSTLRGATNILWYLYHDGVSVYTDGEDWMVTFDTRCRHLQDDNKCRIYETRPEICREFDETSCEVNADDLGTTFVDVPEFLTWLQQNNRRIHTLLSKRYRPGDDLMLAPPAQRTRLTAYGPRLLNVRKQRGV
jgi:Fe-S-cluster containining protein